MFIAKKMYKDINVITVSWVTHTYKVKTRYMLRKTIEGYLDSVPSPRFNTIKTKRIMHAFHSSRYLQSK